MSLFAIHQRNLAAGMTISESLSKAIVEHERSFRPESPDESRPMPKGKTKKKWPKDPAGGWQ